MSRLLEKLWMRRKLDTEAADSDDSHCQRCRKIDVTKLLETGIKGSDVPWEHINGDNIPTVNLGPYHSLSFDRMCALCNLLSALLPREPRNALNDVYLIPARSLHRLEDDLNVDEYERDVPYANYLYIGQKHNVKGREELEHCHEALNAAGPMVDREFSRAMPAREVNRHLDTELITGWLDFCEENHKATCKLECFPELDRIRLVDVHSRRVVKHPGNAECQYFCLSYVWGTNGQKIMKSGSNLEKLPDTIEDAIAFVHLMGKRYLWVDSICIDQTDKADKKSQIAIMDLVYKGAWATIVALESTSADSGLPRINPRIPATSQTSYVHGNTRLMTVMPTLRQQCSQSKWGTRAWTYQEAALSPRCLYFTHHQVYFECNMLQCCESIDETTSPFHGMSYDERCKMVHSCACHGSTPAAFGRGINRDPSADLMEDDAKVKRGLVKYADLVRSYSSREMTYSSDVLNASSALLKQLEIFQFKNGFFWGLPTESLPYALLWSHNSNSRRRADFPSWSWAGWEGTLSRGASVTNEKYKLEDKHQPPFRAWKRENRRFVLLYQSYPCTSGSQRLSDRDPGGDPIYDKAFAPKQDPSYDLSQYSETLVRSLLFLDGLVFQICVSKLKVITTVDAPKYTLATKVNGISCIFECFNERTMLELRRQTRTRLSFLLVDRNWVPVTGWGYDLMLLEWVEPTPSTSLFHPFVNRAGKAAGRVRTVARRVGVVCFRINFPDDTQPRDYFDRMRKVFGGENMRRMFIMLE